MPEEEDVDSARSRWVARAAYAVLGVVLVVGLWRRPRPEPKPEVVPPEKPFEEIFGYAPFEEPFTVSATAPRLVRWCAVRQVLEHRCARCHGTPRQNGAPFPLLTYADTQGEYPPDSGLLVLERMDRAIRHRVMPPLHMQLDPPVLPLDSAERDVILTWIEEGGLAFGGEECTPGAATAAAAGSKPSTSSSSYSNRK